MKAREVTRGQARPERLRGLVICHDVRDPDGRAVVEKGAVLEAASIDALLGAPWDALHVLELDPGDLAQDPAGERLARAAAGDGVEVTGANAGQWTLAAARRGLLRIDAAALDAVNGLDAMAVFTLFDRQAVDAGDPVARAKVTRLAVPETLVAEAEARARAAGGLVRALPFRRHRIGAVTAESLEGKGRARFEASLREKVEWFGSDLLGIRYAGHTAGVAGAVAAFREEHADLVMVAGAAALDPLDPVFVALERLGARMVRQGIPAHPGTHLWLARLGETPLLGIPTCGMFSQATILDVVLPRLLAGDALGPADLAALGHGGLLSRDFAFRFPRYRAGGPERGTLE